MSQQSGNLVHDDVLAKMDALLKKHHDALARGSVAEDFPVLTEVVKEPVDVIPVLTEVVEVALEPAPVADFEADGQGPYTSADHEVSQDRFPHPLAPASLQEYSPWSYTDEAEQYAGGDVPPSVDNMPARPAEIAAGVPSGEICHPGSSQPEQESLALGSEVLNQLDRRILEMLEQRLPAHIVEAVDKALPVVLEEFAMELESMVRDAVAQEIRQQLKELLPQGRHGDVPE